MMKDLVLLVVGALVGGFVMKNNMGKALKVLAEAKALAEKELADLKASLKK